MTTLFRPACVLFVCFSLLTGIAYPLVITGIAQLLFPRQANGTVLLRDGKPSGSSLIGQEFSTGRHAAAYFWSRPSATSPVAYTPFNADKLTGSSGSNLAATNPALIENVKARVDALKEADAAAGYERPASTTIPVDLVTSSASGLDPHISAASAEYQLPRVAKARHITESQLRELVGAHTQSRQFGLFGEPTVNVLELNLDLDSRFPIPATE
ncbi:MAG: potassium-transporting ATPase subunit KdpC [Planctomycetes bacterium]|nr:potassium-transporting ATPase subunit KdpC [Planctomycetota bacterium]